MWSFNVWIRIRIRLRFQIKMVPALGFKLVNVCLANFLFNAKPPNKVRILLWNQIQRKKFGVIFINNYV